MLCPDSARDLSASTGRPLKLARRAGGDILILVKRFSV